jgi:hypothetical protein
MINPLVLIGGPIAVALTTADVAIIAGAYIASKFINNKKERK